MSYQFKTTNIKGKDYVEVTERVKYFRLSPDYKGWSINTEIISMDEGQVVMKTTIRNAEEVIKSTGLAHEVQEASYINKTSYIENCETSSVGRALAMLAIGIDTSMASANEVEIAIAKDQANISAPKKKKAKSTVAVSDFEKALDHLLQKSPQERPMALQKIKESKQGKKFTSAQNKKLEATL
jgi:uncharacterized short protein YbdD (DUF466 family)